MAKAGPAPKLNVPRYPSGQIIHAYREPKQEKPEQVMAVALNQPHRKGNPSQYAGYSFGRLFIGGQIDHRQHRAAEIYMTRAVRYMRHITGTLPNFPNVLANLIKIDLKEQREQQREADRQRDPSAIGSEEARTADEITAEIRSNYSEIQDALADAGMHHNGNRILTRFTVMDRDPVNDIELGAFRSALNVIANRLRL
jgi:hypothetical protein